MREIRAFAPTHLIASEPLAEELASRIRRGRRACEGSVATAEGPAGGGTPPPYKAGWLHERLGTSGADRHLVGTVEPEYDAVMLNPAARRCRPLLYLVGGVSCDYGAGLRRNPAFRGVDLSGCRTAAGCSFCSSRRPSASAPGGDALREARQQLAALRRAGPAGRNCGRLAVRDIRLFKRLGSFFDMVLGLRLPPSEFLFAPRLDALVRAEAELERVLPLLAGRGHRLHLLRMGIEHFSPEENARFNKGLSADEIDRGLALAARLRRAHPASFSYAEPPGYIAFTPWTTLEGLEASLRACIERGFSPHGTWLYSILELQEGTPIAALAAQEGAVLQERYEDPAMAYSIAVDRRQRGGLLPWRFKDRAVAAAFAVIARACAVARQESDPDATLAGDPLRRRLEELAQAKLLDTRRPDLFALEVVRGLRSARPPFDPRELAEKTLERLAPQKIA